MAKNLVVLVVALHLRGGKDNKNSLDYSKWNALKCSSSDESTDECTQYGSWPKPALSAPQQPFETVPNLNLRSSGENVPFSDDNGGMEKKDAISKETVVATKLLVHASKRRQYLHKDRVVCLN